MYKCTVKCMVSRGCTLLCQGLLPSTLAGQPVTQTCTAAYLEPAELAEPCQHCWTCPYHDSVIHARLQSTSKHFEFVSTPVQLSESKTAATLPAYPAIVRSQRLLQDFTAFDMDAYAAGKDKKWQFWNCEPSSFPFAYDKVEHLYMLAGKFTIQYEGAEPVTVVAGDFVSA